MKIKDIESLLISKPAVLLYFYNDSCAPCKILRPKVQNLIESDFPNIDFQLVNADQYPAISAQFGVFSSPTILVFFEGKVFIRESKNISISELHEKIERIYKMIF